MDLRELDNMKPEGHWYYETKADLIFSKVVIPSSISHIVEIGAGSKFFIKKILDNFPNATGWAVDPFFTKNQLLTERNLISVLQNPEVPGDLYLFLDVLEHVENDLELLLDSIASAPKGALIVISVPAFMHLWSGHDEFLGHHRRYTRKDLTILLDRANLDVQHCDYIFSVIYPVALILRKMKPKNVKSDMREMGSFTNVALKKLLKFTKNLNSNKHFGLSVVATAKKI